MTTLLEYKLSIMLTVLLENNKMAAIKVDEPVKPLLHVFNLH